MYVAIYIVSWYKQALYHDTKNLYIYHTSLKRSRDRLLLQIKEPGAVASYNFDIIYCIASNYDLGIYFFPVIFHPGLNIKEDRHLLVEHSCAVYNLWCQQWVLMEANDVWSTVLCVLLCYRRAIPWPLKTLRYMRLAVIWANTVNS